MDIHRHDYPYELQRMLYDLSHAHFVAFDLEISGIQSKPSRSFQGGKQSLQSRYTELKEAAEKYQVLQIGFTIVKQDLQRGVYMTQAYNMFLNPLVKEHLEIERVFSFQTTAVEFLLNNHFRIDAPFLEGVPYLSREEEVGAVKAELARADKEGISDIHLRPEDTTSLNFVKETRKKIEEWRKDRNADAYLNIAPPDWDIAPYCSKGLNPYQRRLVHQLVRAEFPNFASIGRQGYVQISLYDKDRDEQLKANRLDAFYSRIRKQIGLRWFIEAMVGGSLDGLDPHTFTRTVSGDGHIWVDPNKVAMDFQNLQQDLESHQTVLVGHNLFLDLINFYKCFIGALPDTVEQFSAAIHKLFPLIVDTKYMSAELHHETGQLGIEHNLEEIFAQMMNIEVPYIEVQHPNTKYIMQKPLHEAGYDSYMTAQVLIRLSAKLESLGDYYDEEVWLTPPEDPEGFKTIRRGYTTDKTKKARYKLLPKTNTMYSAIETPRETIPIKRTKHQEKINKKPKQSGFAHTGMFDLLSFEDDGRDDGNPKFMVSDNDTKDAEDDTAYGKEDNAVEKSLLDVDSVEAIGTPAPKAYLLYNGFEWVPNSYASVMEHDPTNEMNGHDFAQQHTEHSYGPQHPLDTQRQYVPPHPPVMMPQWDSDFWNLYGNRLRINGTIEGMLELR